MATSKVRVFGFVILTTLMCGCNYSYSKKSASENSPNPSSTLKVASFESVKSRVIDSKCLGCHSNSGGNAGGFNMESYESIRSRSSVVYYRTIEKRDMPPGPALDEPTISLLKNWLDSGMPMAGSSSEIQSDLAVNWKNLKVELIEKRCSACHGDDQPEAGLNLLSIASVRSNIEKIFSRAIIKKDMPLAPYPSLTKQESLYLMSWIAMGMPE